MQNYYRILCKVVSHAIQQNLLVFAPILKKTPEIGVCCLNRISDELIIKSRNIITLGISIRGNSAENNYIYQQSNYCSALF